MTNPKLREMLEAAAKPQFFKLGERLTAPYLTPDAALAVFTQYLQDEDVVQYLEAKHDTSAQRRQVHVFLYDTPKGALTKKSKHHVVRDCSLAAGHQTIWSAFGDDADYDRLHMTACNEAERYKAKLIIRRYHERLVAALNSIGGE